MNANEVFSLLGLDFFFSFLFFPLHVASEVYRGGRKRKNVSIFVVSIFCPKLLCVFSFFVSLSLELLGREDRL